MKTIMITAPSSGSGKTLITLGIIRALKNRGYDVCGFKTGPDYIDTRFLEKASFKRAGNLDIHLMGIDGIKNSMSMAEGKYVVVEGAMGFFDGIYNTFENSSFDISRKLDINSVLVYTPKGEMFSCIPKIKGMVDFEGSNIKAVILNKVRKDIYILLKEKIEEYVGIKVLGYIEKDEKLEIKSRHLGLVQSAEIQDIEDIINNISKLVEKNIDIGKLIDFMNDKKILPYKYPLKKDIRVSIAYDKAFSFYYTENLKLFENTTNVTYFSPLKDKCIPECDFLYIGGGYPEVFKEELSVNTQMINSIKKFAQSGGIIYGECGGLMYLLDDIEGSKMCGILHGNSVMTNKLQRFGYINVKLKRDCLIGEEGDVLTAHEFHKSKSYVQGQEIYEIKKTMGKRNWNCGYRYKNVLGGYPHINFLGNMKNFNRLLKIISESKSKKMEEK